MGRKEGRERERRGGEGRKETKEEGKEDGGGVHGWMLVPQ